MKLSDVNREMLESLTQDWNGYGAPPIHKDVIRRVDEFFQSNPPVTQEPHVFPTTEGGVQLEWGYGVREIELEFRPHEILEFLKWSPTEGVEEAGEVQATGANSIASVFGWLTEPSP